MARRGAAFDVPDYRAVQVDRGGRVRLSLLHRADRDHARLIRDHVAKFVARDRVYTARDDESIDPAQLIEQKKPDHIAYGENGDKRIRRAFIVCGR